MGLTKEYWALYIFIRKPTFTKHNRDIIGYIPEIILLYILYSDLFGAMVIHIASHGSMCHGDIDSHGWLIGTQGLGNIG